MTTLKERLTTIFVNELKEGHENSKEMIASNSTSFDEMGMAHTAPGEFSQEEITDHSNLENTGSMANDTEFSGKEDSGCKHCAMIATATIDNVDDVDDEMDDLASDIVDISVKDDEDDEDDEDFDIDIEDDEDDEDVKRLLQKAHESIDTSLLNTFKKKLTESEGDDYAGPQDFVPDSRINASAVLNALKKEIGEGSEGIHVDQDQNEKDKKVWVVTQIDEKKLPDELNVINVTLKKDGNKYKVKEMKKDFPVMK